MENFQITLAAARVNAGKTQADTAQYMHVTKQTIVNWEKGKVKPKPAELYMMCNYYDCPVDYIFLPSKSTKS